MSVLKEAFEFYKKLKQEEREKKILLSQEANWGLLEQLVAKVNDNPNLRVEVRLKDGTSLLLKTYEAKRHTTSDLINGINYEVVE